MHVISLLIFAAMFADQGPSFSCAHVSSQVNKLICASASLSALDRQLALVFDNMRGQPLDQKKLRADEDEWLKAMQRDCNDENCVAGRYRGRIGELKDESLKVASPAAYAETRPFPVPVQLMSEALAMIGHNCSLDGFTAAPRFLPVIQAVGVTVVKERGGRRFAFLTSTEAGGACEVNDVVALPADAVGDRFLQCSVSDPPLQGFGVRNVKTHGLDGFWSIDPQTHKIDRVPMGVLGIEKAVKCQQPESGE